VLPSYQRQSIGSELVRRLLAQIEHLPSIDLTCAPDLQPFYESLGFTRTVGMLRSCTYPYNPGFSQKQRNKATAFF